MGGKYLLLASWPSKGNFRDGQVAGIAPGYSVRGFKLIITLASGKEFKKLTLR